MSKGARHNYRFGPFRVDTVKRLLLREGETVPLTPKAFETLLVLVQNRGRVLEKEELIKMLWPDSFVEEANLTQNISVLRKALGESPHEHRYIVTIPGRGYRFVAAAISEIREAADELIVEAHTRTRLIVEGQANDTRRPISSLAVLPLVNASADPHAEYLSDGITESIINSLSQLSQLRVMARSVVFRYKGREINPQEVGRELGVEAVLTGRVLQLEDRLVTGTELVDVANGWQLWGAQYNRRLTDILALQEEISREISEKLQLKLTGDDRKHLAKRYTDNTEAYQLYIKGRYFWNKRLTLTLRKAIECFQQAIDIDPIYALAYVGLADCYALLSLYSVLTPREAFPKARAAAMKALEIDNRMAEAHTSLGVVRLFYEWDWPGAEREFARAIALNPSYPDVHQRYGICLVAMGRFDDAQEELRCAQELDPLSLIINTIAGYPAYYARHYDRAIEHFQKVIEMDQNFSMAHFRLGLAYRQKGMFEEALAELEISSKISGDRDVVAALGHTYALLGRREEAERALSELMGRAEQAYVSSYNMAVVYIGLGRNDEALDWLEKAYEERSYWLIYLKVDPVLDPLRAEPRFKELMVRMGFS